MEIFRSDPSRAPGRGMCPDCGGHGRNYVDIDGECERRCPTCKGAGTLHALFRRAQLPITAACELSKITLDDIDAQNARRPNYALRPCWEEYDPRRLTHFVTFIDGRKLCENGIAANGGGHVSA